jgi:hypothetical protein
VGRTGRQPTARTLTIAPGTGAVHAVAERPKGPVPDHDTGELSAATVAAFSHNEHRIEHEMLVGGEVLWGFHVETSVSPDF